MNGAVASMDRQTADNKYPGQLSGSHPYSDPNQLIDPQLLQSNEQESQSSDLYPGYFTYDRYYGQPPSQHQFLSQYTHNPSFQSTYDYNLHFTATTAVHNPATGGLQSTFSTSLGPNLYPFASQSVPSRWDQRIPPVSAPVAKTASSPDQHTVRSSSTPTYRLYPSPVHTLESSVEPTQPLYRDCDAGPYFPGAFSVINTAPSSRNDSGLLHFPSMTTCVAEYRDPTPPFTLPPPGPTVIESSSRDLPLLPPYSPPSLTKPLSEQYVPEGTAPPIEESKPRAQRGRPRRTGKFAKPRKARTHKPYAPRLRTVATCRTSKGELVSVNLAPDIILAPNSPEITVKSVPRRSVEKKKNKTEEKFRHVRGLGSSPSREIIATGPEGTINCPVDADNLPNIVGTYRNYWRCRWDGCKFMTRATSEHVRAHLREVHSLKNTQAEDFIESRNPRKEKTKEKKKITCRWHCPLRVQLPGDSEPVFVTSHSLAYRCGQELAQDSVFNHIGTHLRYELQPNMHTVGCDCKNASVGRGGHDCPEKQERLRRRREEDAEYIKSYLSIQEEKLMGERIGDEREDDDDSS